MKPSHRRAVESRKMSRTGKLGVFDGENRVGLRISYRRFDRLGGIGPKKLTIGSGLFQPLPKIVGAIVQNRNLQASPTSTG